MFNRVFKQSLLNKSLPLAICMVAVALGPVQTANAASLEEDLLFLLETHPQLRAGEQNLEAAERGVDAANSGFLPKVSLNGDAGWENTDNDTLVGAYDTDRYSGALEIRQNLFQGFSTTADVEAADGQRQLSEAELNFRTQQLMFEGIVAYLNVERFEFLGILARDNENTLKQQLRLEDERVQRGAGIEVDVLQAKSRLQRSIERRVGIYGNLREAKARYFQVFSREAEDTDIFEAVPPSDKIPDTMDEALTVALERNLQIRLSQLGALITESQKKKANSGYAPTLDAVARYNWEQDIGGTVGTEDRFFGGLELRWEIFSGFLTEAQVGQAAARHNSQLANLEYTKRKIEEEVRVAWRALETARTRAQLLENAVNIAAEVFVARQKLRDGGKETALNVLDAENEFYAARIAQVSASYEAKTAVYRVLLATGDLTADTLGLN
jgi:outer membrane protein, adhesin transport system